MCTWQECVMYIRHITTSMKARVIRQPIGSRLLSVSQSCHVSIVIGCDYTLSSALSFCFSIPLILSFTLLSMLEYIMSLQCIPNAMSSHRSSHYNIQVNHHKFHVTSTRTTRCPKWKSIITLSLHVTYIHKSSVN